MNSLRPLLVVAGVVGVALFGFACGSKSSSTGSGGSSSSSSGSTTTSSSTSSTTSSSTSSSTSSTTSSSGTGGSTSSSSTSSSTSGSMCGSSPSLANDVQPIFTKSCALANCHSGNPPEEQLDLSAGASFGSLVNQPTHTCNGSLTRVVPSDVANSYLINKITGMNLCAGKQMPNNGSPLPQAEIDTITAWVCEGAPNN